MTNPLPAFVFWLCGWSALLLVALALPLWFRRVPPNWFYGARFVATLGSLDVWYAINARAGRNLVLIGAGYLLLVCALAVDPRLNSAAALLGVTAAFLAALIVNTVALRRAAGRLTRAQMHGEDQERLSMMNPFRGRLARTALLVSLAMGAACHSGDIIADDWGPPAGYSRLTGTVTTTVGIPISSAAVSVGLCRNVGGFTSTSNDGSYRLTLSLPPVGAFVGRADTVRARCGVLVNGSLVDSLEVRFAADSLSRPPQVLNLIVP